MDLVERLRQNSPERPTRDRFEAADEIERLTTEIESLQLTLTELNANRKLRLAE